MIGPSSDAANLQEQRLSESHPSETLSRKKRVLEEMDVETFCEAALQTAGAKRYLREVQEPVEFISTTDLIDDGSTLFSPVPGEEASENCQVARLEVLLVDGTNCTWTTISDFEEQNLSTTIAASFESSSSMSNSPSSISSYSLANTTKDIQGHERHEQGIEGITHEKTLMNHHKSLINQKMNYQDNQNYWESVTSLVTLQTDSQQRNAAEEGIIHPCSENSLEQDQYDDQETGNLSWLLDFKLDPFIEAADDRIAGPPVRNNYGNRTKINGKSYSTTSIYSNNEPKKSYTIGHGTCSGYQETSQACYLHSNDRNSNISRCGGPKKPPFTYTELIEHALQEKGELTVSAIYQWISERYPYYKSNDDRWKNSVRHNLSINPHFRKGSKAPHGAGHLWAIANRAEIRPRQLISNPIASSRTGTKSLLNGDTIVHRKIEQSQLSPMDEVEMATASIMQHPSEEEVAIPSNSVSLEHCAGEILSGVKKEVEVQYLVPMSVANGQETNGQGPAELHYPVKESEFLNPVSKEVLAEECGLISEGYLVTELNPASFGLNVVDPDVIIPENLFGEELNLQFYELASPSSQMQSA